VSAHGGMLQAGMTGLSGSFCLSGVTPRERKEYAIRRMSFAALPRRSAHAGSDSLEHSAIVCHARFFPD
jgi:hypothetical protein